MTARISSTTPSSLPDALCRQCAICCNGLLFKDVALAPADPVEELRASGLKIRSRKGTPHLLQPCAALSGNQCGCYGDRPTHCRQFECLLFQAVASRHLSQQDALKTIRKTKRIASRIYRILEQLGDTNEGHPLARRFRDLTKRLESSPHETQGAHLYGDLTMLMHRLQLLLSEWFYPEE